LPMTRPRAVLFSRNLIAALPPESVHVHVMQSYGHLLLQLNLKLTAPWTPAPFFTFPLLTLLHLTF
jgi:hypothetical protein